MTLIYISTVQTAAVAGNGRALPVLWAGESCSCAAQRRLLALPLILNGAGYEHATAWFPCQVAWTNQAIANSGYDPEIARAEGGGTGRDRPCRRRTRFRYTGQYQGGCHRRDSPR